MSAIKMAIFLRHLLLFVIIPSVISSSFVINPYDRNIRKRDTPVVDKNETKPDIYSFTVISNIQYRYAVTTVSSRVANPGNAAKEVAFTVTLPDSAFVSKFLMIIKDKVYEAYVKEKEEAKKDYQEAVDRGDTAGLVALSARDSNLFTVSVNVEPQSKVTFNLTYEQLLSRTLGLYENVINVNPGQIVKSFDVEVNIDESSNITSLEVLDLKTSNEIDTNNTKSINAKTERTTSKNAKITWSPDVPKQEDISKDGVQGQFIVRYDVDRVSNPNQILIDEGYFVHFYAPSNLKTLPKHVLFVLDISGSMAGRKIEQLREALTQILSEIGEGDYFSLILFSDDVQLWTLDGTVGEASPTWNYDEVKTTPKPAEVEINQRFIVPATPASVEKAKQFAKNLNETGGTNIIAALRKSLQIAQWGQQHNTVNAKPLIIFLTDGQPNVEMSDPEEITKAVKKLNVDKFPIFSLGFGQGADYDFLRKLSLSNSGFARNIYVASDTTLQLNNFYKQVASPLLSNVTFDYIPGQVTNGTLTKSVFNNLYNGSELVVAGKLSNETNSLGGNLTYNAYEGYFCTVLPPLTPVNTTKGHLEKLWAYLYIKELLDKDLISDEKNSTYKQNALKLSLEYGFVTPLTSLVVVKPNETDKGTEIRNPGTITEGAALLSPVGLKVSGSGAAVASYSYAHAPAAPFTPLKNKLVVSGYPGLTPQFMEEDALDFASASATETASTLSSYNISDITWLKNKTDIKFPNSNNSYSVLSGDLPNTEFQSCIIPNSNNTLGHCRHLAHCVIPEILSSFEDFVPYGEACVIDARFVGICCPQALQSQKLENPSLPQNVNSSTPITLAPLLAPTTA